MNKKDKIWKNSKFNFTEIEKEKLNKCKNAEEELILLFKIFKSRGFIKYNREQGNSDGLLGNIFEDLIGVKENNLKLSDYEDFEIKTKNTESSSSLVSLFGYCLDSFKNANTVIREKYGVTDDKSYNKIFNSTIKYSNWNTHRGGYNFKLDYDKEKLYLRIIDNITKYYIDENKYFWNNKKITNLFNKIKNCCYVEGEIDKKNKMVRFTKMVIYKNADINLFWKLLKNDDIVIDFRIGVYKSGKNKGKTHDHGTGFRIKKSKIEYLYKEKKEIN